MARRNHCSRARPAQIADEAQLYPLLGMQYIAPELREDVGEIEAALKKTLPAELLTLADIKGMILPHNLFRRQTLCCRNGARCGGDRCEVPDDH